MEKAGTDDRALDELKAVRSTQQGDAEAFNALVQKYQARIFNTLFRMTGDYDRASELAQEVFIKAYQAIGSFRAGSSFYTWIYRIAVNTVYSERRREMRRPKMNPQGHSDNPSLIERAPADANDNPAEVAKRRELVERIQSCISELDDAMKSVVVLRDIEGMDYEMISEVLELPLGTVKSRLHRGRLELKEKLRGLL
jgi:RNA polymerase sigma-70 factor (ECF subfamily)